MGSVRVFGPPAELSPRPTAFLTVSAASLRVSVTAIVVAGVRRGFNTSPSSRGEVVEKQTRV